MGDSVFDRKGYDFGVAGVGVVGGAGGTGGLGVELRRWSGYIVSFVLFGVGLQSKMGLACDYPGGIVVVSG